MGTAISSMQATETCAWGPGNEASPESCGKVDISYPIATAVDHTRAVDHTPDVEVVVLVGGGGRGNVL